MSASQYNLFEAYGIEMEYMLVDATSLDVRPIADQVLAALAGKPTGDATFGPVTWSNELALHVIELKSTSPQRRLRPLPSMFELAIDAIQPTLQALNVRLLPTGVHPWMNPATEAVLWPHAYCEVYQTYDRIFNCRTHGWSNVQSVHLNLPFQGDEQFASLHAATRLILPLLPALAASSPILDGAYSGIHDTRMRLYEEHCAAVPSMTGMLIPEAVYTQADYRREIFEPIARDMRPLDGDGVMELDFLNARGAIARFDRGSIELRVMDVQEYPEADVAICAATSALMRAVCEQRWCDLEMQKAFPSERLAGILEATTQQAEQAVIEDADYLQLLGIKRSSITAGKLWRKITDRLRSEDTTLDNLFAPIEIILNQGTLSTRIQAAVGPKCTPAKLYDVYHELADCLVRWHAFQPSV